MKEIRKPAPHCRCGAPMRTQQMSFTRDNIRLSAPGWECPKCCEQVLDADHARSVTAYLKAASQ